MSPLKPWVQGATNSNQGRKGQNEDCKVKDKVEGVHNLHSDKDKKIRSLEP